jgi:hypothetical protein
MYEGVICGAPAVEAGAPEADRSSMRCKNSIGSIRFNETDGTTFAVSLLWGKFGGLYACGATFPHTVPLPNIFVTHLFSNQTLKRKDFQEIVRLPWAQEAPGSNPGAPTI